MSSFSSMKVATKLALGFGLIVLLMLISGSIAFMAMRTTTGQLDDVIHDKVPKMQATAKINYYVLDIARNLRNALLEVDDPAKMEAQIKRVLDTRSGIKDVIEDLKQRVVLPEGKAILARILEARAAYVDGQETVIRLLRERKPVEARQFLLNDMRQRQATYVAATSDLEKFQEKLMKEAGERADSDAGRALIIIAVVLLVSICLSLLIAWLIIRDLVARLGGEPADAAAEVGRIAAGDLSSNIQLRSGDTSSLLASLQRMQQGLGELVGEIRGVVDAAARGDFSTRLNLAGKQGFGRDIGEALNQLSETTETGLNDVMRVSQALAAGDLDKRIEKNYPGVFGETGTAVNATVNALKAIVADIEHMVQAANRGDFTTRMELAGKQGFGREIGKALNQLAETTDTGLADVVRVSQALAVGDLGQRIDKSYPGVFGQTGDAVNATVDALKAIVKDIDRMVQAANQGDFSVRLDAQSRQGFGRELSDLLNQLAVTTESGLKDIMRVAGTLAKGDLTQTIDTPYPGLFGQARDGINTTVANLTQLIRQIQEAVALINTASSEIAAGNQDLSSRTEQQASSLEETASSMEELTSTVKENTAGANAANNDARAAADIAAKGGETVKGSVKTMAEISESSKKIADIVGVIDSIAFQTNILALNAAVEAARAGEQGRGFAVVATEVRNLAKRSGDAAREIKDLIGDTLARIENGAQQATLAGNQMDSIVNAIANVSRVISDIALAGAEQATGIEQVTQAVSQMDEVTQQNAALVEEAAAAAESLREQSEQLSRAVAQFRLIGSSVGVPRALAAPPANRNSVTRPALAAPANSANRTKPIVPDASPDEDWSEF